MQYALSIRDHNVEPHLDIEKDIQSQKDGVFTFVLRISNGNIVDYTSTKYVEPRDKYGIVKSVVIQELSISSDS